MKLKIMGIKKMMFIFLMFITITLNGTIYYVAPSGGSDSNAGTNISAPWATWGKAFTTANDDDTVYFRGGIYNHTVTNGTGYEVTVDGTSGHLIYFLNYPDEVPILDCDNVASATGDINVAIDISGVNYVKFRGLVVRNVWQFDGNDTGVGWLSWGITGVEFERCTTYNVHGIGFLIYGSWGSYFINCDAHHCADSLSTTRPGNTGSGFQYINFSETNTSTYYIGCRAWMCSDQGFALGSAGYTEYDNCWAWANGYLTGEGDGFKLGWMGAGSSNLQILVKNCISAYNSEAGFNDNSSTSDPAGYLNIYNNTSYNNSQYGFMFFNTASNDAAELNRITRNNISFQDGAAVFNQSGSLYTHEYNSWDNPPNVTITNADFLNVDTAGISDPRRSDGSLPYTTFLKLAPTSDLINAGTDVGYGNDIGAYQYTTTTYYVSPTGNDGASGVITHPWSTFQKAFNTAVAGDTVYFRGGVYYTTASQNCGLDGTESNPICFFNYPGEKPIVDGINKTVPSVGITFDQASWIHMKGITVRYHLQIEADDNGAYGFYLYDCSNMKIENCVAHNIGYRGFMIYSPQDSIKIINCDAYNVCDSLSIGDAGNNGDGYIVYDAAPVASDIYDYVLFQGCRAWHCSDDGFDVSSEGLVELKDCWAIDCGAYPEYDYGNGFKLGLSAEIAWSSVARNMINCVAAYNGGSGVTSNDNNQVAKWMNIYNNTFAYNENIATFYNTSSSEANELERIMRNNLSFGNTGGVVEGGSYTHEYNSWDIPITVTSADFVSIDSTGIRGARQADGSLPNVTFLKLTSTSDLIDSGTDVGLTYNGSGPDLGYTEHQAVDVDGNYYDYLTIGSQVWFTDNLKTTKYNDNSSISNVTNNAAWMALSTAAYSWYNNDEAYKETYGALYNWHAVNTEDLCPTGWHVPTDAEFKVLEMELGMSESQSDASFWRGTTEGTELKSSSNWFKSGNGTNTSGFNSQPTGFRYSQDGGFYNFGLITYWWTSSEYNSTNAYCRRLDYNKAKIYRWGNLKVGGKPVRCIQD